MLTQNSDCIIFSWTMTTNLGRTMVRMKKELEELEDSPREGIVCYPIDDNITHLHAEVSGPEDTPYSGGTFKIDIQIPERYPMEPPTCQFLTQVYHPNIDDQGRICLDILKKPPKGSWGPAMSIATVLLSLRVLLSNPNPDDPLLVEVATEYKEDRALFQHKAAKYTQQYAMGQDIEIKDILTSAETILEPTTPTTWPLSANSGEPSQSLKPVVTEKRSLAKPTLKRPNLSMRSKASSCPSPQDTIPASPTGYQPIHKSQNGRAQEAGARPSTQKSPLPMSTPYTPDISTSPLPVTVGLSSQPERARSFCNVACPEKSRTEESSSHGSTPLNNSTENKQEAVSTATTNGTLVPTRVERDITEFEGEKVVKKSKLSDTTSTPRPTPIYKPGPNPEPNQPVKINSKIKPVESVAPELQLDPVSQRSRAVQLTSFKRPSSFAKDSKALLPKSNDCPLEELSAEPPQVKLGRTPSQETILGLDMRATHELSGPPYVTQEPPIIRSKHFTSSGPSSQSDENKAELMTTNAILSPRQSSSRHVSSCKEKLVADISPYRSDPPSDFHNPSSQSDNLASIMSAISRKRNLLKKK